MNEQQLNEQFEVARNEFKTMIEQDSLPGLKFGFEKLQKKHNLSEEQAFNEASVLYILYLVRSNVEEDSCKMEDFPKHLSLFAEKKMSPQEYYRTYLERLAHIETILEQWKRNELYDLTKQLGLKGCSSMRKDELVQTVKENVLKEEVMKELLMTCNDDAISFFERVLKAGVYKVTPREEAIAVHFPNVYFVMAGEHDVFAPIDVQKAYEKVNTEEFQKERTICSFLRGVALTVQSSYGFVTMEELDTLLNIHPETQVNDENRKELYDLLIKCSPKGLVMKKGYYGVKVMIDDKRFKYAVEKHAKTPMGVPSKKEVESVSYFGYPYCLKEYTQLRDFLLVHHLNVLHVENLMALVYAKLATSNDISYSMVDLNVSGIASNDHVVYGLLRNCLRVTRVVEYNGMNKEEFEKYEKTHASKEQTKPILPFSTKKLEEEKKLEEIRKATNNNPFAESLFHKLNK